MTFWAFRFIVCAGSRMKPYGMVPVKAIDTPSDVTSWVP